MAEGLLVDAGPLVAILNRRDRHHRTCIDRCYRWDHAPGAANPDANAPDLPPDFGGKAEMPLGKTFFADMFGGVVDRFGVSWMIIVPSEFAGPTA